MSEATVTIKNHRDSGVTIEKMAIWRFPTACSNPEVIWTSMQRKPDFVVTNVQPGESTPPSSPINTDGFSNAWYSMIKIEGNDNHVYSACSGTAQSYWSAQPDSTLELVLGRFDGTQYGMMGSADGESPPKGGWARTFETVLTAQGVKTLVRFLLTRED